MFFFLRFVKFNNCSLNLLFVVHLDNPKTLKNPCTLEPTDFQLYRKMKRKFYFRFSFFFAAKNEIGLPFSFFIFSPPGRKRNSNSLNDLRFSFCNFWKNGFQFSFSFFVFYFRMEFWKRITSRFSLFVFGQWQWNWQSLFQREYLGN